MANHAIALFCAAAFFNFYLFPLPVRGSPSFGYSEEDGPDKWEEHFETCKGKRQSPINIEEHLVKRKTYPDLQFHQFEDHHITQIMNNGHTVMFKLNETEEVFIKGGPLGAMTYEFEQLHFHWGAHDQEGSEGQINNRSFAMELHAVFYNTAYKNFTAALDHPDGLSVLGYFFEASEEPNSAFDPIVKALSHVQKAETSHMLPDPLKLNTLLLPEKIDLQSYFTYEGSLTTPPCLEIVTWIAFKDPLHLSHDQLEAFRDIDSADGAKMKRNFRPVQPPEDRPIFLNVRLDGSGSDTEVPDNDAESIGKDTPKTTDKPDDKSPGDKGKTDTGNDINDTFKEDEDEDADKVTEDELQAMSEEEDKVEGAVSGNVEMFINFFVTVCTLSTIFIMR